jgi:hypothetical protein
LSASSGPVERNDRTSGRAPGWLGASCALHDGHAVLAVPAQMRPGISNIQRSPERRPTTSWEGKSLPLSCPAATAADPTSERTTLSLPFSSDFTRRRPKATFKSAIEV